MLRLGAVTIVAVLSASAASAECISLRETFAEVVARTALVFVGDVLQVDAVILEPEPFVYRVRLRVLESFKGTSAGERTFDFSTTSNDYHFVVGERVLVYGSRNERGKFSTGCSHTRQTQLDDEELVELRALAAAHDTPDRKRPK